MRASQIYQIILVLVLTLAAGGCARIPAEEDPQALALNELRSQSKQPPKIQFEAGIPRFVSVQVPITKDASGDPVVRALDFLERYRDLYRIADPRAQLYLEYSVANETGQHIFFGQRRDDLPVFGAQLAVHLSNDAVIATNGNYLTDIPHVRPPAIDEKRAEIIALKDMGANTQQIGQPKLAYFNRRLFTTPAEIANSELDGETHQTWRLTVVHNHDGRAYTYFVDAQTGAVLFRLNLSPSHAPQKDFHILTANKNGGGFVFCSYFSPTDWFDENGPVSGTTPSNEGFGAFNFTHQIYDFFHDKNDPHWHLWNGHVDTTVRVGLDYGHLPGNAQFTPVCNHALFGTGMATLDIMAHEITHGITAAAISNPFSNGGLTYINQSGALNESYSDVFAAMIDDANWTIGEGKPGGIPFRSMAKPPIFGDPDHLSKLCTSTNKFCDWAADDGGVHTNSGIPNKVAFLIAAGGTHNGITVTGIGRKKTASLYFEVLTTPWLTNGATFNEARLMTVTVAQIAATTGKYGFTSADACVVVNAFASVGLGLPDLDCDGVDDNADTDGDGDTIGDSIDNCPKVSNPGQINSDDDKRGDACDLDADNDDVPNAKDNCPLKPNDQADKNKDGFGDVCSDNDLDGVFDSVDNCLLHKNPLQENKFDPDGIGDACDEDIDDDTICNPVGPNFLGISGPPCAKPDNCPIVKNPSQDDSDKDGYGDACDSCPTGTNTGLDTNMNGIDDACDPDDDEDRILEPDDNCPTVANHDQLDLNGNGIGTACDPAEQPRLGDSPHEKIVGAIQFRRDQFDRFQILIRPDICTGLDCISSNSFVELKVQLEIDLPIRIVDDQGFVVVQAQRGLEKVLRFIPKPDFFYWPPDNRFSTRNNGVASDAIKPYQGRQYFLEIFRSREVDPARSYKISIEATSGINGKPR
jgi:Zn-dependent metalloprotease